MKLRCYICGMPIDPKEFSLFTLNRHSADRVFVCHRKCEALMMDSPKILRVKEAE